jgi:Spy/CpxP family protein refolding chaperone
VQFLNDVKQRAGEFAKENASTLLTAGSVVGTVATAVLAGRAGFKAHEILLEKDTEKMMKEMPEADNIDQQIGLTKTEKLVAIIMSHRMSSAKVAALAAAYGLAERNFSEYKEKVAEKLTGPKQQQVVDDLAQDRVSRTDGYQNIVMVEGEVLCFDEPTARYFRSTMENIKSAVNATNAEILHHDHASAGFFYEELGLPGTSWTDEVGWNTDQLLDLKYSTVMSPDGRPCIAIDFKVLPKAEYIPKHY